MSNEPTDFRQKLFSAQDISPSLRSAYQSEVDSMLRPTLTARQAIPGIFLLILLVPATVLIVRNMFFHHVGPVMLAGWIVLASVFAYSSVLIVRDLWSRTHRRQSVSSIAGALYMGAGVLTVVALMSGMRAPADPKSTFGAFYVFVFYFACAVWSLEDRIARAELASREQMLRLECRLADLVERLGK